MMPNLSFPEPIQDLLVGYKTTGENHKTCSQADVYLYQPTPEDVSKHNLFVKRQNIHAAPAEADLHTERVAMSWLQGKLAVPQVMGYHRVGDIEYLVTTQIMGWSAIDERAYEDIPTLIHLLAQGLQQFHALPFAGCPLDCRLETGLTEIKRFLVEDVLDRQSLPEDVRTLTPAAIMDTIQAQRPASATPEDLVFTHGDYCLPNIIVQGNQLMGFIDLGYAGIADRYRDFVSVDNSIRRNVGDEWVPLFWKAYGVEIDPDKFAFYQMLHDLI
ncbi:MAG: aminoglycoside 3'-phosphotransferase [Chloroflexota bacterium]